MPKSSDAFIDGPVKLKIPPKECVLCGGKFIPTNNRQKYCPDCRELKQQEHDKIDRHKRLVKAREPGEANYALPDRYKDSGDLRDYYHVGVVTGVDPLEITHCTNVPGGIQRDSKIGNWRWGGKLKYVNYDEGGGQMEPIYQAKVHAEGNDYPVKMRAQARKNVKILAKIPQGTIVNVLGIVGSDEGDWGFILYNGQTGYMMNQYLIPVNDGDEDEEQDMVMVPRETLETWADVLEEMARDMRERLGKG